MNQIRKNLGKLKRTIFTGPYVEARHLLKQGPRGYFMCDQWSREMEQAVWKLPVLKDEKGKESKSIKAWFMSGKKHWYQTAFCAWTFQKHSRHRLQPVIIDDGTLDRDCEDGFRRLFPDLLIESRATRDDKFHQNFPITRFPNLHYWREKQLLFRKLTDIHGDSNESRLFFDSDMLFFSTPDQIDKWIADPSTNIVQKDCWESYGYSRDLTESLCGHRLPDAVNIGIFSLNGTMIDWELVDQWTGKMRQSEGAKYNITQCTAAMLMAGKPIEILDAEDYKVWPVPPQRESDERVLGHYVSDSKPWYFGKAWKLATDIV